MEIQKMHYIFGGLFFPLCNVIGIFFLGGGGLLLPLAAGGGGLPQQTLANRGGGIPQPTWGERRKGYLNFHYPLRPL